MEEDLMNGFLKTLQRKGKAEDTVSQYKYALQEFSDFLTQRDIFSFFAASKSMIEKFYVTLLQKKQSSKSSSRKSYSVFYFYEWLKSEGCILYNPAPSPIKSSNKTFPSRVTGKKLLEQVYGALEISLKYVEQRDYVLVDLAYTCGLRRTELQKSNVWDICPNTGTIKVSGKRGNERIVPLGKRALLSLMNYIYHTRPKLVKGGKTGALFVSWKGGGKRMHKGSINAVFRRLRAKYGFDRTFSPHALRHAFATDMLKNGAPLQDVSKMLGHVKLETTTVYTHLNPTDLKKHHDQFHPRSGKNTGQSTESAPILKNNYEEYKQKLDTNNSFPL